MVDCFCGFVWVFRSHHRPRLVVLTDKYLNTRHYLWTTKSGNSRPHQIVRRCLLVIRFYTSIEKTIKENEETDGLCNKKFRHLQR